MRALAGFLVGVIIGLIGMFALVKLGYVSAPMPSVPTPTAAAPAEATPSPEARTTASPPAQSATPGDRIAGSSYAWNGAEATITYAFHGDGTYDASYVGHSGGASIVGISKGTWTIEDGRLLTHEDAGKTERTAGGATTTQPEGAGNVTFVLGDGTITDAKGRVYQRM